MTRTRPITILGFAILGAAVSWLLEIALVARGATAIVPPITLAAALALIAAVVIVLAVPVRRAVRNPEKHRVDPFYATRVVVLAKTSSIAGSLFAGGAASVIVFLLSRSVVPGLGSTLLAVATAIGAVVLLGAGLVAEAMCSIPPDDGRTPKDVPQALPPR